LPAPRIGDVRAQLFVPFGKRIAVLASVCAIGCATLFAIVYWGSGLRGAWLSMYFVVLITAFIGLFLGLMIELLVPRPGIVATVLLTVFIVMAGLGGRLWPLQGMISPVRVIAAATPTRWAFEGLLLLESAEHQAPAVPAEASDPLSQDLVECLFPANSDRMGAQADTLALVFMAIGMAGLAAFIWVAPVATQ
jgi:hypothetical protein